MIVQEKSLSQAKTFRGLALHPKATLGGGRGWGLHQPPVGGGGWGGSFSSQPAALACRSVSLMSVTASSEGSVGGKQAKNKDEAERMGSTDLPTFPVSP